MSTTVAAVITVLTICGAVFCAYKALAALREPSDRDRIIREARARTGLPPAAPDNQPGTNLAHLDECELIWATPNTAGLDRLRQAIRDHREETGE